MTIDIRNIQNPPPLGGQRTAGEAPDAQGQRAQAGAGRGDPAPRSDQVRLSAEARRLQSLQETAQGSSEIDAAKVERVRREIAEGRYHVDPRKLASSMLSLERELLG